MINYLHYLMNSDFMSIVTLNSLIPFVILSEGRRLSLKDQMDELNETEFTRRMSYRETEESLAIQQEDIEDAYLQTQEQIENKKRQLQEIEQEYKEMDKAHLQEMATHVSLTKI